MALDLERITVALSLPPGSARVVRAVASRVGLVLAISYVAASSLSAWIGASLLGPALTGLTKANRAASAAQLNLNKAENYTDLRKSILKRNLFNSTGEFPDEKALVSEEKKVSNFDMSAPCAKATLNVDLVGTIFMDGPSSIATVQEQGYSESDVYREGDAIVGNEQAAIVKIERNRVVLNNKGVKECLELANAGMPKKTGGNFPTGGATSGGPAAPVGEAVGGDCTFEEKYVQDELGPGFGTIIQKARLVPNTTDNVMNGFKIFAIDSASLLGKTGLQNGDIITQVNDTSLKQPEQGFALYQALQDEKEVRIQILRRGTTPMTITCRIK